ncbi:hypothetical protein T439DRAFT_382251 [Meredithblackwellia eburnea MCA 4105]
MFQWVKNEAREAKEAWKELWNWARHKDWKATAKGSFKLKYWWHWLLSIILIVCVGLVSFYRDTIVSKFEPHQHAITSFPVSWLFPILALILVSFPPLFGHEVILLIVGLIWGLWIGFGIACAGTFIGEALCYFLFKYLLTERAQKVEHGSVIYACLARLMRHGGLGIVTIVRFSVIPGHVVTAIQSTVGMPTWIYMLAVLITLPKQLAVVYLGVMFGVTKDTASASEVRKQKIISLSVFFVTMLATVIAAYVVYMRARKLYPEVAREFEARKLGSSTGAIPLGSTDDFGSHNATSTSGGSGIPMYQAAAFSRSHPPPPGAAAPYGDAFDSRISINDPFDDQEHHQYASTTAFVQPQKGEGDSGGNFSPVPTTEEGFEVRDGKPVALGRPPRYE